MLDPDRREYARMRREQGLMGHLARRQHAWEDREVAAFGEFRSPRDEPGMPVDLRPRRGCSSCGHSAPPDDSSERAHPQGDANSGGQGGPGTGGQGGGSGSDTYHVTTDELTAALVPELIPTLPPSEAVIWPDVQHYQPWSDVEQLLEPPGCTTMAPPPSTAWVSYSKCRNDPYDLTPAQLLLQCGYLCAETLEAPPEQEVEAAAGGFDLASYAGLNLLVDQVPQSDGTFAGVAPDALVDALYCGWAIIQDNLDLVRWALCLTGATEDEIECVLDNYGAGSSVDVVVHAGIRVVSAVSPSGRPALVAQGQAFTSTDDGGIINLYVGSTPAAGIAYAWGTGDPAAMECACIRAATLLFHEMTHTCGLWLGDSPGACFGSYISTSVFTWGLTSRYPSGTSSPCCNSIRANSFWTDTSAPNINIVGCP